jgi:hypothetical protein
MWQRYQATGPISKRSVEQKSEGRFWRIPMFWTASTHEEWSVRKGLFFEAKVLNEKEPTIMIIGEN